MSEPRSIPAEPLTAEAFAVYGRVLGLPYRAGGKSPGYSNPATDFWRTHLFSPGEGGQTEVLWVNYRGTDAVTALEVHHLTEQAIVPLTGEIIHLVAASGADRKPDLATARAFRIPPGQGICMMPGCWHATRVARGEVTCLMLTRQSTTLDLIAHLREGVPAGESALCAVEALRLGV